MTILRSLLLCAMLLVATLSPAQAYNVLYTFTGGADGGGPSGTMVFDQHGNLYGLTRGGGTGGGTVFELSPDGFGGWTETVLHSFTNDEWAPNDWNGLSIDAQGNIFGTTSETVFEIPVGGQFTVLYTFSFQQESISSNVNIDAAGNLYVLTEGSNGGAVFQVRPGTATTLHAFAMNKLGCDPTGKLAIDANGFIYGTTLDCGANGYGTIFNLAPQPGGTYKLKTMHQFTQKEYHPYSGLSLDTNGTLYGVTPYGGGTAYKGTAYTIAKNLNGRWIKTVFQRFPRGNHGVKASPFINPITDGAGNMFGTTIRGVYRMNHGLTILHSFLSPVSCDNSGVVMDAQGNLYASAIGGKGQEQHGVVFEITP